MSAEHRGPLLYLDSSALVKLILPEAESFRLAEDVYDTHLAMAARECGLDVVAPR